MPDHVPSAPAATAAPAAPPVTRPAAPLEESRRLSGLSLVMPAHNEWVNLQWLLPHIAEVLPGVARRFEVIVADDGSTDGTRERVPELAQRLGITARMARNEQKSGMAIALRKGLALAVAGDMEYTAFTDADGQFEVADLALLVPLLDHADLVGGWRIDRADAPFRNVVSGTFNVLLRVLYGLSIRDVDCALKVMRTDLLRSMTLEARSAVVNAELYLKTKKLGRGVAQRGVPHYPRTMGRRSGGRPRAIARAVRELVTFRVHLARQERAASRR